MMRSGVFCSVSPIHVRPHTFHTHPHISHTRNISYTHTHIHLTLCTHTHTHTHAPHVLHHRPQPYYKRQSTIDSAFGSDFDSSVDIENFFPCKQNIEEEEAAALAKVRSMIPEDHPHPSLSFLTTPSDDILVYVQPSVGKDDLDVSLVDRKFRRNIIILCFFCV